VPIAVSRLIAERAARHNPAAALKEYPGVAGEEGHEVNAPGNRSQWIDDYRQTLRAAFAQCEGSSDHVRPADGGADDGPHRSKQ